MVLMKWFLLTALLLLTLAGCSTVPETVQVPETAHDTETEMPAQKAYEALLSGDTSLLEEECFEIWGLQDWTEFIQSNDFTYEYTYLDVDGDGQDELLLQMEDEPAVYNGVFHYADGRIHCWNHDRVEMSCQSYPLRDGTMVQQYDHSDSTSYTIFRYQPDGDFAALTTLYYRGNPLWDEDIRPYPWYGIDGKELTEAEFAEEFQTRITSQLLDRSAWTVIEQNQE